jgi:hypothetical protein
VEGRFQHPDGDIFWAPRGRIRRTLIVPRPHFVPEPMRSVESL